MGSSKTANALMVRYNYEERGQVALLVKPEIDQRDGAKFVASRMGLSHPCIYFSEMRAMPEEELKTKFSTDYAKILLIPVSINPAEDTDEAKAKAKEQASELINKYLERAKAGEDMETLVYEARKELSGNQDLEKPEAGTSFTFVNRENSSYSQEVVDTILPRRSGSRPSPSRRTGCTSSSATM